MKQPESIKHMIPKEPVAIAVLAGYALIIASLVYYIIAFILAFLWLDCRVFIVHPVYCLFYIAMNAVLFPASTLYEELNFNNIKRLLLILNYAAVCILLLSVLFYYSSIYLFPMIFSIPVTPFTDAAFLVSLARVLELFICGLPLYGMIELAIRTLQNKEVMETLFFFRLSHYLDLRSNKEYSYDLELGRSIENKQRFLIREKDRYLHQTDNGVSGAGKSALVMVTGICQDMNTRQRNERAQKKELKRMLREGKAYRVADRETFSIRDYRPYPVYQKEFDEIFLKKYRVAGQTVMAPDASMLDKVYDLAKARHIPVNRIDPTILPNGRHKEGFVGFNPFFIPPEVAERQDRMYTIAVERRAVIYRDVMQELYILDGSAGDAFFTGINKTLNYSMTILCILTYPFLKGRQANPVDSLLEMFNIQPLSENRLVESTRNGKTTSRMVKELVPNPRLLALLDCYYSNCSKTVREQYDPIINTFFKVYFVDQPELGQRLFEQSFGLRNLISGFVNSPFLKPILTARDDKCLSIPQALERGEIILYNFFHEMGTSFARVWGLFFLYEFDAEVKARPGTEDTRNPHFFRLDEAPVILTPLFNSQIALYRKYRVPMEYAFQSLSQFDETRETQFISHIMMSCGTQLVFGRANLEEMEHYSKLAGMYKENVEQISYNSGSFWSDTSMTQQIRTTPTDTARTSQESIRYRNFAECTIFGTRDGVSLLPVIVRFQFLDRREYHPAETAADYFDASLYPVMEEEHIEETEVFEDISVTYELETISIQQLTEIVNDLLEDTDTETGAVPVSGQTDNTDGFAAYDDVTSIQRKEESLYESVL